jgi:enoyl-CoA hydratase
MLNLKESKGVITTDISFSAKRHIGLVNLQRPQALNALTLPMIKALQQQLELWQVDDNIHAVVLQAEDGRAFCAGGDVRWLYEAGLAKNPEQMQFFWHEYRLNHFLYQFSKPYISLMDGITMGGGVGISMHGSHPIATERFIFAMPETSIGFFPDIGASYLLSLCPGQMGLYLALTGDRLSAQTAQELGLVKQVIARDDLAALLESLIEADLSANPYQTIDACLQNFAMPAKKEAALLEKEAINFYFAANTMEEIVAKLQEKRDEWAIAILRNLQQKSPLSLKVTLQQMQKAKFLSMTDCMKMDYRLVSHFMRDSDFYEGVRALLVDKDKSPHWQPASLELVSDAKVAEYFTSGEEELVFYSGGMGATNVLFREGE